MGLLTKHKHEVEERIQFSAENTPLFHTIQPGGHVFETTVCQRGSLVVTGGTANGTSKGENPAGSVQRFDVDAVVGSIYPAGKLKTLSARSVLLRQVLDEGYKKNDLLLGANGYNGAAGTYTFNQPYSLKWALPGNLRSAETSLKTDAYSSIGLQITTGGRDNQFTGNDRAFNWNGVYFDILHRRELMNQITAVLFESDVAIPLQGANSRQSIKNELPQDWPFLDFLLYTESTAAKTLVDTILNRVTMFEGNTQFFDQYDEEIKVMQEKYFQRLESMDGLYYLPIAQDGLQLGARANVGIIADLADPAAGTDVVTVVTRRVALPNVDKSGNLLGFVSSL